jgi:hypothetical protein
VCKQGIRPASAVVPGIGVSSAAWSSGQVAGARCPLRWPRRARCQLVVQGAVYDDRLQFRQFLVPIALLSVAGLSVVTVVIRVRIDRVATALAEADLDRRRGSLLLRRGRAAAAARSAWTTGRGSSSRHGSMPGSSCPSDRCSASSTAPRADGPGRLPRPAPSCGASPARPASGDASRRTSSGMRTPSRSPVKGVPLIVIQRHLGHIVALSDDCGRRGPSARGRRRRCR